jgi:hypothetical protein
MKDRLLKLGIAALVALAIPASIALAHGAGDAQKGLTTAAQHAQASVPTTVGAGEPDSVGKPEDVGKPDDVGRPEGADKPDDVGKPEGAGRPETAGQPEGAGQRPQNHGWFVSQIARNHSTTGKAHGQAVSAIARGNQGKPPAASH